MQHPKPLLALITPSAGSSWADGLPHAASWEVAAAAALEPDGPDMSKAPGCASMARGVSMDGSDCSHKSHDACSQHSGVCACLLG